MDKIQQTKQLHVRADPANPFFGGKVTLSAVKLNDFSYRWLKNDVLLSTAKALTYDGLHTPNLTIFPFTYECEGKYKCIISSKDGEVMESNIVDLTLGKKFCVICIIILYSEHVVA